MKVDGIFNIKKRGKVITGSSPWEDKVYHKIGDILICGEKRWRVVAVDSIHQGCFSVPTTRWHGLQLEPIDHEDQPNIGDELL
jgi:hypothetical protein